MHNNNKVKNGNENETGLPAPMSCAAVGITCISQTRHEKVTTSREKMRSAKRFQWMNRGCTASDLRQYYHLLNLLNSAIA